MNLYVDLDNLQLRASGTDARNVQILNMKRGDALPLTVRFYQGGSQVRLNASTILTFILKEQGEHDGTALVLDSSFVASTIGSPDSDPHYTATPSLNTTALNALFLINSDPSDDPSSLDLMGELSWEATEDSGPTTIKTFTARMENDIYRGNEGAPTEEASPSDWLDAQNISRGISPIRSGTSTIPASPTPNLGDRAYLTDEKTFYVWNGSEWVAEAGPKYDVIVVDGDDRSTNADDLWPDFLSEIHPFKNATVTSVAADDNTTLNLIEDFSTNVDPLAPTGTERGLYLVYAGVHDIFELGGQDVPTVRTIYDNLVTLWGDARDLGFEVVAFTLQHHTFADASGIDEAEQRQVQLNKMILSDPSKYDFLIPLHELIPDETTYGISGVGENYIRNNTSGNQFIAQQVARILGDKDRTRNVPPQAMIDSTASEYRLKALLGDQLNVFHETNLALSEEDTSTGGTIANSVGFKRLSVTASLGSRATIQTSWPLLSSSNSIAWNRSRYRGLIADLDMVGVNADQIVSIYAGTNTVAWNDSSIGFQVRKNGSNYEVRIQVIDGTPTTTTGSWTSIGSESNLKFILFAKDGNATLLYSASNGQTARLFWSEITSTGAPTSVSAGNGHYRICSSLETTAASTGTGSIDVRSITVFESETLPFDRLSY